MDEKGIMISVERIKQSIVFIRGQKVMLDRDLAELYGVETKVLKQAVRRNIKRFPDDFMFELTKEEFENWRSQFVTSNMDKMGLRYKPMAFTEQGVAMLSSVLRIERAACLRATPRNAGVVELSPKLKQMEKKYDEQFKIVFEAIRQLMTPPEKPRKKIGFVVKEKKAAYGKRTKGSRKKK